MKPGPRSGAVLGPQSRRTTENNISGWQRKTPVRRVTVQRAEQVGEGVAKILDAAQAEKALRDLVGNRDREHAVVFDLETRNQFIGGDKLAIGALAARLVDPRDVPKSEILIGAAAIAGGSDQAP